MNLYSLLYLTGYDVALDDLKDMEGDLYQGLAKIVEAHNGLWSAEAERFLLSNAPAI